MSDDAKSLQEAQTKACDRVIRVAVDGLVEQGGIPLWLVVRRMLAFATTRIGRTEGAVVAATLYRDFADIIERSDKIERAAAEPQSGGPLH